MKKNSKIGFALVIAALILCSGLAMAQETGNSAMSMKTIIFISIGVLGGLGILFGGGLAIASKIFEVKMDPKINEINEALPQVNCGACGQPGCAGFAEAVVKGKAEPNGCLPGGSKVAEAIGRILGVQVDVKAPPVATILCTRKKNVKRKEAYHGIEDCSAAVTLGANIYECAYACLGLGTCAKVCPFGAIYMDQDDMPVVLEEKCTACGKCVEHCPVHLIRMTPRDRHVHILCVSTEPAKIRAKVHKPGACIGCSKCVKTCPEKAISMVNTVAVIDYSLCTVCEKCIAVCPTKAIGKIRPGDAKLSPEPTHGGAEEKKETNAPPQEKKAEEKKTAEEKKE